MQKFKDITGSGKGGGGHTPTEYPNTLISDSIVSVIEVLSEGEIKGLVNGNKSIYFDDTPIEADDGSKNYDVEVGYRYGTADQPHMEGWPSAESIIDKNLDIKTDVPAIHSVLNHDSDAVKIIIGLPSGLSESKSNGDMVGTKVSLSVLTADGSGVYSQYETIEIDGKSTSAFYRTYRVNRPSGSTGAWSVKVIRNTPDSDVVRLVNATKLINVVEIQDVKLQYNDTAYVGIKVSAKSVSNKIPVRSYLIDGLIIKVPSNYDPISATYSGQWNGDFKWAWSDNPAWVLYDVLTNDRYGCGRWINEDDLDVYSFYDAAVYNDELVSNGKGGLERRFTFNGQIIQQGDAISVLQQLAGSFNAVIVQEGRLYRVQQDRPSSPVAILTNSNVIDGAFVYSGSPHQGRHTQVNVTYQDKANKYREQIATVEATPSELERYNGIAAINIKAIGAVTESQALRAGKWHIETELNQKEIVKFGMSFNGFALRIGDIVKIADRNYSNIDAQGRILSIDGNVATIDRKVNASYGDTFSYITSDNEFYSFDFNDLVTDTDQIVLPVDSPMPMVGSAFAVESIVKNRQFRITGYSQSEKNVIEFTAIQHDPNKYARIEQGLDIPAQIYSNSTNLRVKKPTDLKFTVNAFRLDDAIRRDLNVSWVPAAGDSIASYSFAWRVNGGNWSNHTIESPSYDISNIADGEYDVKVMANGYDGSSSQALTGAYTYSLSGGTGSPLNPVMYLQAAGTGTNQFNTKYLELQWKNPDSNTSDLAILRDFRIDVYYPYNENTIVNTYYAPAVPSGEYVHWLYTYDQIKFDFYSARSFRVVVYCRDTNNKLSAGTSLVFTNPAPVAPVLTIKPGVKSLMIETQASNIEDYEGTVIYASKTDGFTPGPSNKIYQGANTFYILEDVTDTYYFRVAHYDSFGSTELYDINLSAQYSGTPSSAAGITNVTSLPANPAAVSGQLAVYLDSGNANTSGLYAWDGSTWKYTRDGASLIANSVTADKMAVNNLAAITANMGSITSGSITLDNAGYIRGGASSYSTGSGFWQGYDSGAYKWRVGTPGSSRAEWTGSAFNIYDSGGNLTISSGVVDYSKVSGKPSSLSNINTTEANKLAGIAAGATVGADSSNLKVGTGANLLYNAGANLSNDGWNGYPNFGRNMTDWNIAQKGSRYGTFVLREDGKTGGGALYIEGVNKIPVTPGQRYELSIYTGAHRCRVAIGVDFWDAAGNYLGSGEEVSLVNNGENNEQAGGGVMLGNYRRIGMFVKAPANAATSRFLCWKNETKPGYADSYMFACLPFYGVATPGQTELSPWSEGSSAINTQITPSNSSTYIAAASIGAAQIGSVALVGVGNFSVKTAYSGERIEMDGQGIKVFDANGICRVQLGNLSV